MTIKGLPLKKVIRYCWFFFWGSIFAHVLYKKECFDSVYFKGTHYRITGRAWEWTINDLKGRIFLNANRGVKFPVSPYNTVINQDNIFFNPNNLHIFMGKGRYFQAQDAKIIIGDDCFIANNVGLITSNHNLLNPRERGKSGDIVLGKKCWIGLNSVITAGVTLGDHTVVGAGAVVTKSFPNGYCVLGGVPAKVIREFTDEERRMCADETAPNDME